MTAVYPTQYAWAARVDRMTKDQLALAVRNHPAHVYAAHPPATWRKAELVTALVEMGCPLHRRADFCQECQ